MRDTLPVTVDKSHLVTIGEKLYSQSIELIRELVNNAYDADATIVEITTGEDHIEVRDNGIGMDLEGLRQYFIVGSHEKLSSPVSPVYQRNRIGQFGIGKFACLSACKRFEVFTQKGDFAARVVFDKQNWEQDSDTWQLPLQFFPRDPSRGDGTTVRLVDLNRVFQPEEIERKIIEGVPLREKNFSVKLNGFPVRPRTLSGQRVPFLEGTRFGPVTGEIVILPESRASAENLGIEVRVKGATIRRELFGMESWGKVVSRIRGEVHADFLPITSDRSGFIVDSPEYQAFSGVMGKIMREVKSILGRMSGKQERRKTSIVLKEALDRVHRALARNPDFSPFGAVPYADDTPKGIGEVGVQSGKKRKELKKVSAGEKSRVVGSDKPKPPRPPQLKVATPDAVVKRVKFGEQGVTCCLDHFGEDGPESFTEGTIIYINRDNPLYRRTSRHRETLVLNVARLITQEISLMKVIDNPRQAFELQGFLLRDAFREEK